MAELNNPNIYGRFFEDISLKDKIKIIIDICKFKRITYDGSARSNECLILNDKVSMHATWSDYVFNFNYEIKEVDNYYYGSKISVATYGDLKTITEENFNILYECMNELQKEEYQKKIEERQEQIKENGLYYELEKIKDGAKLYMEGEHGVFYIESGKKDTVLEVGGISFLAESYHSMLYPLLEFLFNNKNLFKDVKQIKNGWLWNDMYYENKDDIIEEAYDRIREYKLKYKLNEGLNYDDLFQ